jgi:hypothetical protein
MRRGEAGRGQSQPLRENRPVIFLQIQETADN